VPPDGMTPEELTALRGDTSDNGSKARPRGTLPYLPHDREPEPLRVWLTIALRPPKGWTVQSFERAGRDARDPCSLIVANGRESRTFRFKTQRELMRTPRSIVFAVADGWLAMPHLTGGEIEDVWGALTTLGRVLTEHDEVEQTRDWIEQMLPATLPLTGYSLVPDSRHDALMAIKAQGTFAKSDALSLVRPGNNDEHYQQRPIRFVDKDTGEQWMRTGETATYVRWVVGVEPLSHATLRARLHEIGMTGRLFEDYRPPHPKLSLYQLPAELIEALG
jgi:hypothetical protein